MHSLFAALLALGLLVAGPGLADAAGKDKAKARQSATAGGKGKTGKAGKGEDRGKSGDLDTHKLVGTIISATERALIGDYIETAKVKHKGLPPGLAKRQHLPPGLQKQIVRNGTLPPGLAKRGLPSDLRGLLPYHKGRGYRVVGTDIVLIETATNLILDVMKDVLR